MSRGDWKGGLRVVTNFIRSAPHPGIPGTYAALSPVCSSHVRAVIDNRGDTIMEIEIWSDVYIHRGCFGS